VPRFSPKRWREKEKKENQSVAFTATAEIGEEKSILGRIRRLFF
jgi:hypothetical protein